MELTKERARIFRILHIANVEWILHNGLRCKASSKHDPDFVQIGNPDLIGKRSARAIPVAPGGTLDDYIPFYFTPYSPMLYNIKTGWNGITKRPMRDIVVLVTSLPRLEQLGVPFLFSDRHAYLLTAKFFDDLSRLDQIDWKILQDRDFKRDAKDLGKLERYQAEALVYRKLPIDALTGVVCYGPDQEALLTKLVKAAGADLKVAARPEWYL